MAGMLAGVETARKRRIHQSSVWSSSSSSSSAPNHGIGSSRRSPFSLFSASLLGRSSRGGQQQQQVDEKLGQLARQAKERLDERLRAQRKSLVTSELSEERLNRRWRSESEVVIHNNNVVRDVSGLLRTEVYGSGGGGANKKKNGIGGTGAKKKKKLIGGGGWGKKQWEQQRECAICLEEYMVGENLVTLPCAHKFHSTCLLPWLHSTAHCPCCRMPLSQ